MDTIEITLNFRRTDFEEIYFRNGQARLMLNPRLKTNFNLTILFLALLSVSFIYSLITAEHWSLFTFALIVFVISVGEFYRRLKPIIDWKNHVKIYLDDLSKYKKQKMVITSGALTVIQDDKESIEKWETIKKGEITDNFILLDGKENYIFPRKSMRDDEFTLLKKIISEKLNKK